ncbi:hypothetical protein ACFL27_02795 [candidate division CSSED10-310 bacterium]|uniref:Uncharacterized protein n=1 Tax=candidate division CSSED10-310 bacterium TaxID=2855610 RepID=A0ABV6YSE7_UNCC1
MAEINTLIKEKLVHYPPQVQKLALEAVQVAQSGMSEPAIMQHLEAVLRALIKQEGKVT